MSRQHVLLLGVAASLAASPAFAHGVHGASGLAAGLAHPLLGLDHLLGILSVGVWAGQQDKTPRWMWPAVFVAAMALGFTAPALLGGGAEAWILASLLVAGAAAALNLRAPQAIVVGLLVAFGLAHGAAHGLEAPVHGRSAFAAGMLATTLALLGISLGLASRGGRLAQAARGFAGTAAPAALFLVWVQ